MGHGGEGGARRKLGFVLEPEVTALIPLGFKARLPVGHRGADSSAKRTSFKKGLQIPNAPGTIDSDYPDEWMVIVRNPTAHAIRIEHGERIAQMVLARYEVLSIELGKVGDDDVATGRVRQHRRLSVGKKVRSAPQRRDGPHNLELELKAIPANAKTLRSQRFRHPAVTGFVDNGSPPLFRVRHEIAVSRLRRTFVR